MGRVDPRRYGPSSRINAVLISGAQDSSTLVIGTCQFPGCQTTVGASQCLQTARFPGFARADKFTATYSVWLCPTVAFDHAVSSRARLGCFSRDTHWLAHYHRCVARR